MASVSLRAKRLVAPSTLCWINFFLKTHQMFPPSLSRGNLNTQQLPVILAERSYYQDLFIVMAPLSKSSAFNYFSSTIKRKTDVSNSSGLKSVFEKVRFRVGLVWMVGKTVELELRF